MSYLPLGHYTHPFFKGLPGNIFRELIKQSEIIYNEQYSKICISNTDCVYIINEGTVLVQEYNKVGKPVTIDILNKNDLFGENINYSYIPITSHLISHTDTYLIKIKKDIFEFILNTYPNTKLMFNRYLCKKMNFLYSSLKISITNTIKEKLAELLLLLFYKFGKISEENNRIIRLKITHNLLSSILGTTRENITKNLSVLKKSNIIRVCKNKNFIICDFEKLIEISKPIENKLL